MKQNTIYLRNRRDTEPYVRWCEREVKKLTSLLDLKESAFLYIYFCPKCSQKASSPIAFKKDKSLELCSQCGEKIIFSGYVFILVASLNWLFFAMILTTDAIAIGNLLSLPIFALGVFRFIKEHLVYLKNDKK